jgi:nitrate/nitrite transporter NarK
LLEALHKPDDTPAGSVARAVRVLAPESFAYLETNPPETQPALLVGLLNDVLQKPELYQQVDPNKFELPGEARSLAAVPADELTPAQVTRRNRLLLEAAFPSTIRKIYGEGWRPVVLVYGLIGLGVAGAFWLGVRDWPRQHPGCNAAEVHLIEGGRPSGSASGRAGALPLGYLIRSPNMWLSSVSQFGTNFGWSFLLLLLPTYLTEVHHMTPLDVGWLAALPILVGMVGMFCGGLVTDVLTRALGVRWGRGLPMASTRFLAMAAYLACLVLDAPALLTIAFCMVALATDLGTAALWAFNQDVGGRYVGSVLGWGNMWGNIGAAVSPLVLLALHGPDRWAHRFLACALAFFISGVCALGVDARVPVAPIEED